MPSGKSVQDERGIEFSFTTTTIRKIRQLMLKWGCGHYQQFDWRSSSCKWHSLIAEILLQRTNTVAVVDVFPKFVSSFPSPADLGNAPLELIEQIIYPLGLKWRAPLLKKLGEQIAILNDSPPDKFELLIELPGVGQYTAMAYLSFHAGKRGVIVDSNIVRWLCRMVDSPMNGETRRKKWLMQLASSLTPVRNNRAFNYAILDFSMLICSARPKCEQCPLGAKYCAYRRKMLSTAEVITCQLI